MAEVKVAHFTVVISGLSEEIHNTLQEGGNWRMGVEQAAISYEWDRLVGYWRVVQTVVTGRTLGKVKSPGLYTWSHGDSGKPMWVVLLEHAHYPQRTIEKRERVL